MLLPEPKLPVKERECGILLSPREVARELLVRETSAGIQDSSDLHGFPSVGDGHDNGVRERRRDVNIILGNLGLLFVDSKGEGGDSGFKRVFME